MALFAYSLEHANGVLVACEGECVMNIKKLLPAIIVAGAALLAVIIALILPGASATQTAGGVEVSAKASLIGMMFGSTKITSEAMGMTMEMTYGGGMSIFGLISFLALVAGIALIVASIFVADKNLDFIGSICIAVAGVLVLLLLVAGTDVTSVTMEGVKETTSAKFADVYAEMKLGVGAIIYAILAILGGAFGIVNKYKKIV